MLDAVVPFPVPLKEAIGASERRISPADSSTEAPLSLVPAHPTIPVPAFRPSLAHTLEDQAYARVLAERLVDLGDDAFDLVDGWGDDDVDDDFSEITETRVVAFRPSSTPPPARGDAGSVLASLARVPYLRRSPRDISLATIDHGQAFVLALVDGRTSVEQILESSPLPVLEVVRVLQGFNGDRDPRASRVTVRAASKGTAASRVS